jgi:hypothetical protein
VSPAIRIGEFLVYCLPFLEILILLGILAAATIYLFRARPMRSWLRICMRLGGGVLALPLVLCVLLLITMAACTQRPRVIVSPDSRHTAEYSYEAGFLGRDLTYVRVRGRWSLPAFAYWYAGPSDWSSTEVRWLDNEQLLIRYSVYDSDNPPHCTSTMVAGVFIRCVAERTN